MAGGVGAQPDVAAPMVDHREAGGLDPRRQVIVVAGAEVGGRARHHQAAVAAEELGGPGQEVVGLVEQVD